MSDHPAPVLAILEATREVIAQRGPEKFSFSAVARAAGVSRPTLYKYFPTRDDLLEVLTDYEKERFDRHLQDAVDAAPSAARQLDAALRLLVTYLDDLMGPDPIGTDLAFALGSLNAALEPQAAAFARVLGDALDEVPAVRAGKLSRVAASELFLRFAYSHYLVPHSKPEVLLTDLRNLAGLAPVARTKTTTNR
jgi:TetR/AcrR family transcriptional repressor of uid operon